MGDSTTDPASGRAARYLERAAELRLKAAAASSKREKARLMATAGDYATLAAAVTQFYAHDRAAE